MPFWLVSIGKSNREQIETKKPWSYSNRCSYPNIWFIFIVGVKVLNMALPNTIEYII